MCGENGMRVSAAGTYLSHLDMIIGFFWRNVCAIFVGKKAPGFNWKVAIGQGAQKGPFFSYEEIQ